MIQHKAIDNNRYTCAELEPELRPMAISFGCSSLVDVKSIVATDSLWTGRISQRSAKASGSTSPAVFKFGVPSSDGSGAGKALGDANTPDPEKRQQLPDNSSSPLFTFGTSAGHVAGRRCPEPEISSQLHFCTSNLRHCIRLIEHFSCACASCSGSICSLSRGQSQVADSTQPHIQAHSEREDYGRAEGSTRAGLYSL